MLMYSVCSLSLDLKNRAAGGFWAVPNMCLILWDAAQLDSTPLTQ